MAIDTQDATHAQSVVANKAERLLQIVTVLAGEIRPHSRRPPVARLNSALERELGFDSLSRVELLTRIEKVFSVRLSDQMFTLAETPADLLRLISGAAASQPRMTLPESKADTLSEVHAVPREANTLTEALEWHAQNHPERPHVYLCVDDEQEQAISYQALWCGAEAVAAGLQHAGLDPGETVAIMLPTSEEYLFTFFGILLAGGIPVPIYPPARLTQIEDHLRRHVGILSNAGAAMLVTVAEASRLARLLKSHIASLRHVFTVEELSSSAQTLARPTLKPDDIAFLQYTSGSTADPKGVVLTHANLLTNIRAMGNLLEVDSTDVFVSWLPMYHDMGLIGAWLGSLYHAMPLVLIPPLNFLGRPARWLWAIHRHRATLSAAPNFAYELCLSKIDEQDIKGLDLSSWRMAANGAEPVSPDTLIAFAKRFARYGFREEALCPVYGLAEGSVGLAFPPMGRGPIINRVDRETFRREGRAIPTDNTETQTLRFVGCGQTLPGHEIRIVDAAGLEVVDRQEGRLQFRGPSATSGYYRNPEASNRLFDGDWLESGDLAYVADGEVFITGRVKDVIIRAGRNIYPQELEEAIGHIPGIRGGCVAVFAATGMVAGTESLVVLAETQQTDASARDELHARITVLAVDLVGTPPDDIVLAAPHTVLKTSSGKLRRAASRDLYQSGKLGARRHAPWWQLVRFAAAGLRPQLYRSGRLLTDLLYMVYTWAIFAVVAPVTWLCIAVSPRPRWCWAVLRGTGRLLLRLSGTPFRIEGLKNLPSSPCVIVANHASYLDGLVLSTALPRAFKYVAKRELDDNFVSRILLRRLGVEYVERFDKQRGIDDARRTAHSLRQGHSLIFFAEGTFVRTPGLLPFRMGAFVAAAEAGVPIVTVTLRGTRNKLRCHQWFVRRGGVSVIVGEPISPQGRDWSAAVALRDAARREILRRCGEPDLAQVKSPI